MGLPVSDTLLQTPPSFTWNLLPRALASQADAGLVSPGPGSPLVWIQEGSETEVVGRKGRQGRGQPLGPCLSPLQCPGPLASASPGFCSRWIGCFGLLGERPAQGCLSGQISGSEQSRGTWGQSRTKCRGRGVPGHSFRPL